MKVWNVSAKFTHADSGEYDLPRVELTKTYAVDTYEAAQAAFFEDLDRTGLQEELNLEEVNITSAVESDVEFTEAA